MDGLMNKERAAVEVEAIRRKHTSRAPFMQSPKQTPSISTHLLAPERLRWS